MNNQELRLALQEKFPVTLKNPEYGKITCKCVSAIIYRMVAGTLQVSAELEDLSGRSVIIADPKNIERKEEKTNGNDV